MMVPGFRIQGSDESARTPPRRLTRRNLLQQAGGLVGGAAVARLLADGRVVRAADSAATLPAIGALPSTSLIDPGAKSVVAHIQRKEAIDGSRVHEALLGEMLEEGLKALTGAATASDGWRQLLKPDDVIGIKFNQVGGEELGTTLPFAFSLVNALTRAEFAPERIVLIEAPDRAARQLKTRPRTFGWSGTAVSFGSGSEELAALLQEVTAIINVPFLKTHNLAGVSGCLKNLSHALIRRPAKYHANRCAPYVGDIVALPQIRSKLRIHIVNGLRAVYREGPAVNPEGMWTHAGLIMSTDPVAADTVGLDVINEQRAKAKLAPIGDAEGHVPHVHAAAERGLGTDDPDYIHIIRQAPL